MARASNENPPQSRAHAIYQQLKQRIESRFMARATHVQWRQTGVLKNGWKVYRDPSYQLDQNPVHRPTGGVFYGMPSFRGRSVMDMTSPLVKVGRPEDKPCPNCGSKETLNRLQQEIDYLEARKKRREEKQLHLFPGSAVLGDGSATYFNNTISVTHDVCADCGTCFDFERQATAPVLRERVRSLRLETESAVDSLGRLGEG